MARLFFGVFLSLVLTSCAAGNVGRSGVGGKGDEPDIRVLLSDDGGDYRIVAPGGARVKSGGVAIADVPGKGTVELSERGGTFTVSVEPGGLLLAAQGEVTVEPKGRSLSYDREQYAGVIRAIKKPEGGTALLNVVPLETYLQGVLPYEIGNPGPDGYDAVRTQAIAARTYAVGKMRERSSTYFDVYATVMDQVYKGVAGQTRLTSGAINDTRGRVLDYRGKTVKAYYSACCGGHTSDIRLVWPDREPADYLYGILDRASSTAGSFCTISRHFRWRYSFTGRELGETLRQTIATERGIPPENIGELKDVRVVRRSRSGRVVELVIDTTRGSFTFTGDRIRWILMRDVSQGLILPSVMFRLDKIMEGDRIAFISISGGGNGHGVGMCQTGAIAMAKKGYTYEMILSHYYPGCRVATLY